MNAARTGTGRFSIPVREAGTSAKCHRAWSSMAAQESRTRTGNTNIDIGTHICKLIPSRNSLSGVFLKAHETGVLRCTSCVGLQAFRRWQPSCRLPVYSHADWRFRRISSIISSSAPTTLIPLLFISSIAPADVSRVTPRHKLSTITGV